MAFGPAVCACCGADEGGEETPPLRRLEAVA
jgi:hypothetical protein